MALLRTIGTMSGTSMDGVDVALVETDGQSEIRLGAAGFFPYSDEDRVTLRAALAEGASLTDRHVRPGAVGDAERVVTARHFEAVSGFLSRHGIDRAGIDLVGFHGQTVLHRPAERLTVQIGDGPALARALGVPVAFDFRAADVAAGGQGAPLVPVFHQALVHASSLEPPVVLLNVGGVANLTWVDEDRDPVACDTGPGNALLDDLMLARTGAPIDRHGLNAAKGRANQGILQGLLAHPFFSAAPPKSLDRNTFASQAGNALPAQAVDGLALEDAAATLTAFTAAAAAGALDLLPRAPRHLVVCGGGARNPILLRELVARTACRVSVADDWGWSADAMEAQAFGYLAARRFHDLPLTFPGTTGVDRPMTGGQMATP